VNVTTPSASSLSCFVQSCARSAAHRLPHAGASRHALRSNLRPRRPSASGAPGSHPVQACLLLQDNVLVLDARVDGQVHLRSPYAVREGAQARRVHWWAAPHASVVQMSPSVHTIGTRAMERKDQPNGICEPPMHSSCLLCTCRAHSESAAPRAPQHCGGCLRWGCLQTVCRRAKVSGAGGAAPGRVGAPGTQRSAGCGLAWAAPSEVRRGPHRAARPRRRRCCLPRRTSIACPVAQPLPRCLRSATAR